MEFLYTVHCVILFCCILVILWKLVPSHNVSANLVCRGVLYIKRRNKIHRRIVDFVIIIMLDFCMYIVKPRFCVQKC